MQTDSFPRKPRENVPSRICAALDRKCFRVEHQYANRQLPQEAKRKCADQDLYIPSTQMVVLDDPCATTYKQFGKICICHIGYVAICQTGKIDIC